MTKPHPPAATTGRWSAFTIKTEQATALTSASPQRRVVAHLSAGPEARSAGESLKGPLAAASPSLDEHLRAH